jgi:RHS repeat-associated protein
MKKSQRFAIGLTLLFALITPVAFAQVGNDNPTGVAGEFQGEITTGCDYSPYTTTARRTVTDLVVAGGVGAYPLTFARTSTSRYNTAVKVDFGTAGSWLHSYQWSIDTVNTSSGTTYNYAVNYPNGSRVLFSTDPERTNPWGDPYAHVMGVRDRLQVIWDTNSAGRCYLILNDGGRVYFTAQRTNNGTTYTFSFTLQSITDPYGQTTTITGSPTNSPVTVTEPAGRWIKMFYRTITSSSQGAVNDVVIDHVTGSDGRSVQYNYTAYVSPHGTIYTSLTSVVYYADPTLTATYSYQNDNITGDGRPLLSTCYDPMYMGPMVRIAYKYVPNGSNVVAGEILSENYFDGTNVGPAVSTLSIPSSGTYNRQETTGDGRSRKFLVGAFFVPYAGDFKGAMASQYVDTTYYYINLFIDRNGNTTNWTNTVLTGKPVQITYPLTPNDTPTGTPRGTVTYTYGSATCPDPNNRDANNPYYVYSITDEGGNATVFLRDANKRIIEVNYPDGGTEGFSYNSFGQALTHLMKTGGTESFNYDARGLKQTYLDPYHTTGNPSFWYQYDSLDRVSGVTDALGSGPGDINHTTSFTYNSRGQLLTTTHPTDPIDGQRHSIANAYNQPVGTLASVTDELSHITSFTYDNYNRIRSLTTSGHNTLLTANSYYDISATGDDYTHTDSNITHTVSPSGKKISNAYDSNKLKISVVAGDGTSDAATTSFAYDNNGNRISLTLPNEQPGQLYAGLSSTTRYDERNRPMSTTDAQGNVTVVKYDAAGRKASVTRANGQVTTYDSYDGVNRLLQQTIKQTPDPDAVTKYTYYTSGLRHSMQDPRLVATNSSYFYTYSYDLMGRKTGLNYPPDSWNAQRNEVWHYDTDGRLDTFTNRESKHETITYDNLNRLTDTSWDDGNLTPAVHKTYDAACRLIGIGNTNATISRQFFNDGLLNSETTTYTDNTPRTVTYTYDSDCNKATIQYPNSGYSFTYSYTGRNQLWKLLNGNNPVATYGYDPNGNLTSRAPDNPTTSSFTYDSLDRVTHISHVLTGTTRTFDYAYDSIGNRKWTKRDGGTGDVFGNDLNDQSISVLLNVANPDTVSSGSQTINYDANGNRTSFSAYGPTDTYAVDNNSLNQYHTRNGASASYDIKGNITVGFDGSTYSYDAQSRLLAAAKGGTTDRFTYDGLNRQVSRTVGAAGPIYNIYDDWKLIAEYSSGSGTPSNAYLEGVGLVKNLVTNKYYYQDAAGSTSHLADNSGNLLEWYRYDLQGTPFVNGDQNNHISAYGVRHLFTGEQWYAEIALYDLRNRFYSPDTGRFLQADPLSFAGDSANLYRYCGNNPIGFTDPFGLTPGQSVMQFGFGAMSLIESFIEIPAGLVTFGVGISTSEFVVGLPDVGAGTLGILDGGARFNYGYKNILASTTDFNSQSAQQAFHSPSNIVAVINSLFNAGKNPDNTTPVASADVDAALGLLISGNPMDAGLAALMGAMDIEAAQVEEELTSAASTFDTPSAAQSHGNGPFDDVNVSLQPFGPGGVLGGYGGLGGGQFSGGSGSFSFGTGGGVSGSGGSGGCDLCGEVIVHIQQ